MRRGKGVSWRLAGHWSLLCIINYTQQGYRCRIHNKKKRKGCVSIYTVGKTYSSRKKGSIVEKG